MSIHDTRVKHLPGNLADDFPSLIAHARDLKINLVVPGPEAPLIAGIKTVCQNAGIRCFGPSVEAAKMEGSKAFAKEFMIRHSIPTAKFQSFRDTQFDEAVAFLETMSGRVVVKASGIAAGKGVIIPETRDEAKEVLKNVMIGKEFGSAGDEVVIEEFLEGEELSILSLCDGYTIRSLPPAQDHKQIYDGDRGPMTGGMGCYSPTKIATPSLIKEIHETILQPTIDGMRRDGVPFVGCLFTGLMITSTGPMVLEYNVRFGDPETQTLLPLLNAETDLLKLLVAATDGYLDAMALNLEPKFSATVVAVAGGYPGSYARGEEITIGSKHTLNTTIFHAGTNLKGGKLLTNGGRVLAVNAQGSTLQQAFDSAYTTIKTITYPNVFYRKDIGHRNLNSTTAETPLTYAQAGVSITAGNELVSRIKALVASTARPGTNASIGGFGGLFSLSEAGYHNTGTTLIGAIDGIGTKLFLAQQLGIHNTVGIDLVAMNVNDLVVQGAEPLFFLDCYTCSKLDVNTAASFVSGVASGCRESNCALIGGETAEMPGLFSKGIPPHIRRQLNIHDTGSVYDGIGAAIGAVAATTAILPIKSAMKPGDILLGLASTGLHSNGFSLVRTIVEKSNTDLSSPTPWNPDKSLGETLLTPTRIYVRSILAALAKFNASSSKSSSPTTHNASSTSSSPPTTHNAPSSPSSSSSSPPTTHKDIIIKGLAHITGGGLTENIPRALPKHLCAKLDAGKWSLPDVFQWLKEAAGGGIADEELIRVWNCGVGMVVVVDHGGAADVKGFFEGEGETVFEIGCLEERVAGGKGCVVEGMEGWR